jgi:hypothetical protein
LDYLLPDLEQGRMNKANEFTWIMALSIAPVSQGQCSKMEETEGKYFLYPPYMLRVLWKKIRKCISGFPAFFQRCMSVGGRWLLPAVPDRAL